MQSTCDEGVEYISIAIGFPLSYLLTRGEIDFSTIKLKSEVLSAGRSLPVRSF